MSSKSWIELINENLVKANIIKESELASRVFMGLIFIGIFTKIYLGRNVTSNDGSVGSATALIWGYLIISFSVLCIIFIRIVKNTRAEQNNPYKIFKLIPIPLLLLIFVLFWAISTSVRYHKEINMKEVPEEYFKWSGFSTIVIIAQMVVVFIQTIFSYNISTNNLNSEVSKQSGEFINKIIIANYLFLILNIIIVGIQQVILDRFTMDG